MGTFCKLYASCPSFFYVCSWFSLRGVEELTIASCMHHLSPESYLRKRSWHHHSCFSVKPIKCLGIFFPNFSKLLLWIALHYLSHFHDAAFLARVLPNFSINFRWCRTVVKQAAWFYKNTYVVACNIQRWDWNLC